MLPTKHVMPAAHFRFSRALGRNGSGIRIPDATVLLAFVLLTPVMAGPLLAQQRGSQIRVLSGSALRTTPGGPVVGTLTRSLDAEVESEQGASVRVHMVGFVQIEELDVEPSGARGTLKLPDGGVLRTGAAASEPVLAQLRRGTVLFPGQKVTGFLSVTRSVWVDKTRVTNFSSPADRAALGGVYAPLTSVRQTPQPANPTSAAGLANPAYGKTVEAKTPLTILTAPNGADLGSVKAGSSLAELSADGGWTRVRIEGWVPSRDLLAVKSAAPDEPSAADVRSAVDGMKGRIVHWVVEALSYQLSDGLRRELDGTPYILALGPGKERAILYLAVPDSLVSAARGLPPMSVISVAARVRTGRSQPGGVPILDILELSRH